MTRASLGRPAAELLDDPAEENGRDREVVRRPRRAAQLFPDRREGGRVVVVAVDVPEEARQLREGRWVEAAVLLEAVLGAGLHLVEGPAGLRDADDRDVEVAALQHRLERREDLLVRQIARGPEEDEGVRPGSVHVASSTLTRGDAGSGGVPYPLPDRSSLRLVPDRRRVGALDRGPLVRLIDDSF